MKVEATIPAATLPFQDRFAISVGPATLEFRCTDTSAQNRLRIHGVAPGAGFVLDAEVTRRDAGLHVDGELHVSGTLAGLGQRELALLARRLVSSLAGLR